MGSREREETKRRGGEEIGRPSLGWERGKVMLLWFIVRSAIIIGHHHVSVALYSLQHVRERSSMLAAATNDGPLFLSSLSSVPPLSTPLLSRPSFRFFFRLSVSVAAVHNMTRHACHTGGFTAVPRGLTSPHSSHERHLAKRRLINEISVHFNCC